MVLPDSHEVSRASQYSGAPRVAIRFRIQGYHPLRHGFPADFSCLITKSHIGVLQPRMDVSTRFGLFPVRSPLLRESLLISFPLVTEMFHFTRSAPIGLCIQPKGDGTLLPTGFPIQKSPDQRMFGSSPRLIAAYHVFHRLSAPRHPPVALINLFSLELPSLSLFNCKRTTAVSRYLPELNPG